MNQSPWNGAIWSGIYSSFAEAAGEVGFLENSTWLGKQVAQATEALEEMKANDAISRLAKTSEYVLPAIAASMMIDLGHPLRILDFGGGLASSYLPLRAMVPSEMGMDFVIVENEEICDEGRKLFALDREVTFRTDMPYGEKFDIVHAGSSMHYVEDWIGMLASFAELKPKQLIFADLPSGDIETFVTVQNYYGRKIPVRFWNIMEFIGNVESTGYKLIFKSRYRSKYLDAMKSFDDSHRLNYFAQLVFKRK